MFGRVAAGFCGALACALMAGASAQAAAPPAHFDFRGLEFRYGDDEALAAGRAELAKQYPVGASASEATRALTAAGAVCRPAAGRTRCVYTSFQTHEDHMVEVNWTVDIAADAAGALRTLAVDRSLSGV
jgi:hypothetical protein